MKLHISRILALLLAFSIAGFTDLAQAQQTTTPAQQNTTPQNNAQPQQNNAQQTTPPADTAPTAAQDQSTTTAPAQDNAQTTTPAQDQNATKPATDATQKPENNASDPNYVPPAKDVLPNAPSTDSQAAQDQSSQNQKSTQQPLGTAAAKEANTVGGAASKPAGTALAGVKQKQSRGLLIKVGAVLAAGAALGAVYAMSRGTSPTPPGAIR